jgi:hypothetical protein
MDDSIKDPPDPPVLDYGRSPRHYPPVQQVPAAGGCAAGFVSFTFCTVIVLLLTPRYTAFPRFLGVWLLVIVGLLLVAVLVGYKSGRWSLLCGMIIALLLSGGLCGLLYSACGNPFRPFL